MECLVDFIYNCFGFKCFQLFVFFDQFMRSKLCAIVLFFVQVAFAFTKSLLCFEHSLLCEAH